LQTRAREPKGLKDAAPKAGAHVARVKGPLTVRTASGATHTVPSTDATRAAKAAVESGQVKANGDPVPGAVQPRL
jgi:hypothetical protein